MNWTSAADYQDIRYELSGDGIAKITIDRPEVRNAFRPETIIEISDALDKAREDTSVGVTWTGMFPVDRRYPATRVQLAPRQLEWWARRRVRALPPERREHLDRLRDRVQGRLR